MELCKYFGCQLERVSLSCFMILNKRTLKITRKITRKIATFKQRFLSLKHIAQDRNSKSKVKLSRGRTVHLTNTISYFTKGRNKSKKITQFPPPFMEKSTLLIYYTFYIFFRENMDDNEIYFMGILMSL